MGNFNRLRSGPSSKVQLPRSTQDQIKNQVILFVLSVRESWDAKYESEAAQIFIKLQLSNKEHDDRILRES